MKSQFVRTALAYHNLEYPINQKVYSPHFASKDVVDFCKNTKLNNITRFYSAAGE